MKLSASIFLATVILANADDHLVKTKLNRRRSSARRTKQQHSLSRILQEDVFSMDFDSMSMSLAMGRGGGSSKSGKVPPPPGSILVTSGADSGPGTLRSALDDLASGLGDIIFISSRVKRITIESPLEYIGTNSLTIQAEDMPRIIGSDDFDLLTTNATTNVDIRNVEFEGLGHYSINNQGQGKGIFVDIPDDAVGDAVVTLEDVKVSGVASYGILVNDCTEVNCGNGNQGTGGGSAASVSLTLDRVTVEYSGKGRFDGDGLRVNERGPGDLRATITASKFNYNGADGVELDEAGLGDVNVVVRGFSEFIGNGDYCFVPECVDDVEAGACIAAANATDSSCIDEGELDLDDGFDIDEADGGDLIVQVTDTIASNNLDEGFDFDEAGDGTVTALFAQDTANYNFNEGVKVSSDGSGDVLVRIADSSIIGNLDDGAQLESEGAGLLTVSFTDTTVSDSKKNDIKVEQKTLVGGTTLGTLEISGGFINGAGIATDNMNVNP